MTKVIEHYTSMVPSGVYLAGAFGAIGLSLGLRIAGHRNAALFVGLWAPTVLTLGMYNKMVKLLGSE